jgi:hypothetical protein
MRKIVTNDNEGLIIGLFHGLTIGFIIIIIMVFPNGMRKKWKG